MAEIIGIVGSVASLVALAQETAQACNKLAKFVRLYKNASSDISDLCDEIFDVSHTVSLVHVTLLTSRDQSTLDENATIGLARTLAGLQKDLDAIKEMITAVNLQPHSRRSAKGKLKWAFEKVDITSAMDAMSRKKQTLLTKLNIMHMRQLRAGVTIINTCESKLDHVTSSLETLKMRLDTASSESSREVQRYLQPSFASLEDLVRKNIQQAISATPQDHSLTTLHAERLADQISKTLLQQNPDHFQSPISSANDSAVGIEEIEADDQAVVQKAVKVDAPRIAVSRHTASRKLGCIFGKLEYRYYASRVPLSTSEEGLSMETNMTELSFTLAPWLQAWAKRGSMVAQLTNRCQGFDFSISLPRLVNENDTTQRPIWNAVRRGDIVTLQEALRERLVYPTDVNTLGDTLLTTAAGHGKVDICKLLLQHGAAVGINNDSGNWPVLLATIVYSPWSFRLDILRLLINHGADPTLVDSYGWDAVGYSLANIQGGYQDSHDAKQDSAFHFFVKSDMLYDIHWRDCDGCTLLMIPKGPPLSVYQELLKLGADPKALDYSGNTVLHHYFRNLPLCDGIEKVLQGPSILRTLILAGADHRHVNRHGRLPHEMVKSRPRLVYPVSLCLAFANCIWHEALRGIDTDPAGHISIESSSKLQTYTDERSHCCLLHWRSFSSKLDCVHLESLAFEDQIIVVFERWIIVQKIMSPFIPELWRNWTTRQVAKVKDSLSEFRSRRTELDRAGSTGVRQFWEGPLPQSRMELHDCNKQQDIRQDCGGVTCDGNPAGRDLPKMCNRCERKIRKHWRDYYVDTEMSTESDTQSDEESDSDTQGYEEDEEDYFSAEEI